MDMLHPPDYLEVSGEIVAATGSHIIAQLPKAAVGDRCTVHCRNSAKVPAQVIGFRDHKYILGLLTHPLGISLGDRVDVSRTPLSIPAGELLLGRVIDALGNPLDGSSLVPSRDRFLLESRPIYAHPPPPLSRAPISTLIETGIASIDGLLSIAQGQRIGIFASAGVGKTTLLGMLTRNAHVDITVVALVGERGREVTEFVEETLGDAGMRRTVVVVATSDQPSLLRQLAAFSATSIAEYFRDRGKTVLLIVDSLTRTARAIRETSLASGELPVRQGYTPSVYTELPRLLERAGNNAKGSITAVYTVLTNEAHETDPLADEIKSVLDGHIVLSKEYANRGIYPAIDIPKSISRLMPRLHPTNYLQAARTISAGLGQLDNERITLLLGGTPDARLAQLLALEPEIVAFLTQDLTQRKSLGAIQEAVFSISRRLT